MLLCGQSDVQDPATGEWRTLPGSELHGPSGERQKELAATQWSWITERLSSSDADFVWVAGHFPIWSAGKDGTVPLLVATAGRTCDADFYATLLALLTIHAAVAEGTQAQAGGVGQRQQPAAAALTTAAYDVAGEAISIGEMRRRLTEASPTTRSRDFLN